MAENMVDYIAKQTLSSVAGGALQDAVYDVKSINEMMKLAKLANAKIRKVGSSMTFEYKGVMFYFVNYDFGVVADA